MGYLNIYVSKDAHLSIKNQQLILKSEEKSATFPLEDVNSILIENLNTSITTYALSQMADMGIICFVCDQNHLPNGVVLPFCGHYQTLTMFNYQMKLSKPLQKQLWKAIIENKIKNQNDVLNMFGGNDKLRALYRSIQSGDAGNNEAKASLIYFKKLFGSGFSRRDESNAYNSFLNYGYTIIRGYVTRSISVHGMMPFLGIFHHNQFNQFNLADDLMEIFRPAVDMYVKTRFDENCVVDSLAKADICNVVNIDVLVDNKKYPISYAIELFVESFQKSIKGGKNFLKSINICPLEFHKYE